LKEWREHYYVIGNELKYLGKEKKIDKRNKFLVRRNRLIAYGFLFPNLLGFLIFTFIPLLGVFALSFVSWDTSNPIKFVGLQNYIAMFKDDGFKIAFVNTLYYTLAVVPLTVIISLLLAVILNKGIKGTNFFRLIHYFPYISSMVAVAVVWQFLYQPEMGPINSLLKYFGINNPPRWTASEQWALPAVIIVSVWKSLGYYMIIFLAGLQSIPQQLYEAATIDGASGWQQFWNITLPMISPTTFFAIVISLINSFKVFDQIYIMTKGGPGRATSVLVYYIYQQGFVYFKFGYASAIAMVLFLVILGVTIILYRTQGEWVTYMS